MITINEKKQEYFDKTVLHMAQQGRRAVWGSACQYRTDEGLRCNFGIFIPDELYTPDLEGHSLEVLVREGKVKFSGEVYLGFAYELQYLHDFQRSLDGVKQALYQIASQHGLDDSKVALITKWEI